MLLTNTPKIVDDLISRLKLKTEDDGYTTILADLEKLGKIRWFTLVIKLNKLLKILKEYPDNDVQTLITNIGTVYWANYYTKLADIIELTEVIEAV